MKLSGIYFYHIGELLVPENLSVFWIPEPQLVVLPIHFPHDNLTNVGHGSIKDFPRLCPQNVEVVALNRQ